MSLIVKWIGMALAVFFASRLIPGIAVNDFYVALIVAFSLGLVNVLIKPIVLLLTLPINILTLGLFTFVINALLFWSIGAVLKGFSVNGFTAALIGSLFVSVVNFLINKILSRKDSE